MTVYAKVVYLFYMPQDYEEMKRFEAENDTSIYRRTEDTIATRYTYVTNATYPYKSKNKTQTDDGTDDCNECKYIGTDKCNDCLCGSSWERKIKPADCPWK